MHELVELTFDTERGDVTVTLDISPVTQVEAVDVYGQSPDFDWTYRIDGTVNGTPGGTLWFHAGFCDYHGEPGDTWRVASRFLADWNQAQKA